MKFRVYAYRDFEADNEIHLIDVVNEELFSAQWDWTYDEIKEGGVLK